MAVIGAIVQVQPPSVQPIGMSGLLLEVFGTMMQLQQLDITSI